MGNALICAGNSPYICVFRVVFYSKRSVIRYIINNLWLAEFRLFLFTSMVSCSGIMHSQTIRNAKCQNDNGLLFMFQQFTFSLAFSMICYYLCCIETRSLK